MESPTPDQDILCQLCLALRLRFWNEAEDTSELADAAAHHKLFHEPCADCGDADFECGVQLCNFCQHLRFRHLTLCCPRIFPDLFRPSERTYGFPLRLSIQPENEGSEHCELCRFFIESENQVLKSLDEERAKLEIEHVTLCVNEPGFFQITTNRKNGAHCTRFVANEDRPWLRPHIDWEWLRDWLHELPEPELSNHLNVSQHDGMHNVLVIDVVSECVVHLPTFSQYLALSYVWGPDSNDQFYCSRSNLSTLSKAGALQDIHLPRTISDAIIVCQRLEHRFLWVDRLCIVQDAPVEELSKQLNQMADIYYHATLTLVAATGDSAAHGLAGVSYARNSEQVACQYGENFELATPTPSLQIILWGSTWWTRGWTFQEYVASKRLLFFTDHGLYLKNGLGKPEKILTEGHSEGSGMHDQDLDLCLLKNYTKRSLKKESDILHASSGFLRLLYGNRSSYGMPWDEFDNAILWTPDAFDCGPRGPTRTEVFPTWSWISSTAPVRVNMGVEPVYSLAYWGRLTTSAATTSGPLRWEALEPTYPHTMSSATSQFDKSRSERYVVAALSWLHGCLRTEVPSWLLVDCACDDYAARLEKRWSKPPSNFWKEAFQG